MDNIYINVNNSMVKMIIGMDAEYYLIKKETYIYDNLFAHINRLIPNQVLNNLEK
jgi:hypothetical protein